MAKQPTHETCLWERQERESSQAWEAFLIYRDMGGKRSLRAVGQKLGKSSTLIERWSVRWGWLERCRQYDNSLLREEYEELKKSKKRVARNRMAAGSQLQGFAMKALKELKADELGAKDIRLIIDAFRAGFDLEDGGRNALLGVYEEEIGIEDDTEEESVVIYVPDDGLNGDSDAERD